MSKTDTMFRRHGIDNSQCIDFIGINLLIHFKPLQSMKLKFVKYLDNDGADVKQIEKFFV